MVTPVYSFKALEAASEQDMGPLLEAMAAKVRPEGDTAPI